MAVCGVISSFFHSTTSPFLISTVAGENCMFRMTTVMTPGEAATGDESVWVVTGERRSQANSSDRIINAAQMLDFLMVWFCGFTMDSERG